MRRSLPLLLLAACYGPGSFPSYRDGTADDRDEPQVDLGDGDADQDGQDIQDDGNDDPVDLGGDGDADGDAPPDEPETLLCQSCAAQGECGIADNACVRNGQTGEQFCAEACNGGSCPSGYYCENLGGGFPSQCLPNGDSCADGGGGGGDDGGGGGGGGGGDDGGDDGGGDDGGGVSGDWGADVQHCVEEINRYREQNGRPALQIDAAVQDCAEEGAEEDSQTGSPHGHFSSTGGCGVAWAENEIPGWPLDGYGSVTSIIDEGLAMMMGEGPGGGHYENMLGDYTHVGCGIYVTAGNEVWSVQDFR